MHSAAAVRSLFCVTLLLGGAACSKAPPGRQVSPSGRDEGDCLTAPCRTIGYAVRQANPGDTILVDSGTYREAVEVRKRLVLLGHQATIDAQGQSSPANGFFVSGDSAAGTHISGFTIRNAGLEGIFVLKTSRVTIENNVLEGNDAYGTENPLCSKHQSDCGEAIHLQSVRGAVVRGNSLRHNLGGILLTDEDGPVADDTISENIVADSPKDCGITLASHWIDTTAAATPEVGGVYRNVVLRNKVSGAGGVGIGIFAAGPGAAAWGNIVEGNDVRGSVLSGLAIHGHAPFQNLDGNVFRGNTLADNGTDVENPADKEPAGISIFSAVVPIRGTVVTGNRISNEHYGVVVLNAEPIETLAENTIDDTVAELALVKHK